MALLLLDSFVDGRAVLGSNKLPLEFKTEAAEREEKEVLDVLVSSESESHMLFTPLEVRELAERGEKDMGGLHAGDVRGLGPENFMAPTFERSSGCRLFLSGEAKPIGKEEEEEATGVPLDGRPTERDLAFGLRGVVALSSASPCVALGSEDLRFSFFGRSDDLSFLFLGFKGSGDEPAARLDKDDPWGDASLAESCCAL